MFPRALETDRLRLERLRPEDTLALYDHAKVGAPHIDEITQYVGWTPHATPKETLEFVRAMDDQWEEREGVCYAVRPREGEPLAGELGGTTGFDVDWPRRTATLGLWLREPLWGRGYSGERAAALLALAFGVLDLEVVAVTHHPDNDQSRRAIEKYVERFGGRREGSIRNGEAGADGSVYDVTRYSIAREEWREATGGEGDVTYHWA